MRSDKKEQTTHRVDVADIVLDDGVVADVPHDARLLWTGDEVPQLTAMDH